MTKALAHDGVCDVAIIGFGPVGAALANLLAKDGLTVVAFDREAQPYALPRAVHFDDEIMRVFQTIGLADAIAPSTNLSPGMRFIDAQGRLVLDWSRPAAIGPHGWHTSYRFHQPDLERILRAGVARHDTIDVRLRSDVYAVDADDDGVTVHFEDLGSGALRQCRARYVVGCDGARSLVRRLIGSELEDLGFHERWLVVDAILKRPRPDLGDYSIQHCDPQRPATYVRGVGDRRRWEISVIPGDDERQLSSPDFVWSLLGKWIGPDDADLERAVCYTFHSTLARRWRKDRLLIAGDSAHQTPPFLGQGMCAGIRDAANLAWKLGRVLRGEAGQDLLDTYQSERLPHVREYIELAVRLGGLINMKAAETALAGRADADAPQSMNTLKPKPGPGLFVGDGPLRGTMAPQPILLDGTRFDDRIGMRFAAVLRPELRPDLLAMTDACKQRGITLVGDEAPGLQDWLKDAGIGGALVRPDRYVMGTANTSSEMAALLRSV